MHTESYFEKYSHPDLEILINDWKIYSESLQQKFEKIKIFLGGIQNYIDRQVQRLKSEKRTNRSRNFEQNVISIHQKF